MFQGKIYLIDTGPYVLDSLTALGISVNELEGIFHTHAHDDHFAGLTSLVRTDHRIKYFATPLVRSSVMKKLSAVMSLPEKSFENAFEFHDLAFGKWNDIGGLEVQPFLSLHPARDDGPLLPRPRARRLQDLRPPGGHTPGRASSRTTSSTTRAPRRYPPRLYESSIKSLHLAVDLKKIDAGGGLIHGRASDFAGDQSAKIVLSHISGDLSAADKEIGSNASFGLQDVLIESRIDYTRRSVESDLAAHFPEAAPEDLGMLLNCPLVSLNTGHVILRKGAEATDVHLVACGVVEMIDSGIGAQHMLSTGTMIGEVNALSRESLGSDLSRQERGDPAPHTRPALRRVRQAQLRPRGDAQAARDRAFPPGHAALRRDGVELRPQRHVARPLLHQARRSGTRSRPPTGPPSWWPARAGPASSSRAPRSTPSARAASSARSRSSSAGPR